MHSSTNKAQTIAYSDFLIKLADLAFPVQAEQQSKIHDAIEARVLD